MEPSARCDVLIAGSGPAGLATALYLLRARPDLAGRVVALDKAHHPRLKTCGGGLIPRTIAALDELGVGLGVAAVEVTGGRARTEVGTVELPRGEVLCTVIRRDAFDAYLAEAAQRAGLRLIQNCRLLAVEETADCVRAVTDRGVFEAPVLVGADGSGSRVRRTLFGDSKHSIGRAITFDIPVAPERAVEFRERIYRFDFTCVQAGIRGYSWSFPCLIGDAPHLNAGIYDQCPGAATEPSLGKPSMVEQLRAAFPELNLVPGARHFRSFPIRWYEAGQRFATRRVLLAGDAAGVDPLMGEGISYAFEHGKLAAAAIRHLLEGDIAALAGYDRALHQDRVGRKLARLNFAARRFYGRHHRFYFRLASVSRKAQCMGVDWYNGARRLDEVPARWLMTRWAASVLLGFPVR